jgi:hypothetical protein
VIRYGTRAPTVLNCDVMDAIRMEYQQIGETGDRIFTKHAAMIKLDFETYRPTSVKLQ